MSENTTRSVRVRASELEAAPGSTPATRTSPCRTFAAKSLFSTSGPSAASTAYTSSTNYALSKKNSPTCSSPSAYTDPIERQHDP